MKAVQNGRLYNTENATRLAAFGTGFKNEVLYRTPNGRYFLHKSAAEDTLMLWGGKPQVIEPVSEEEAIDWCAEQDEFDVLEEEFGPIEDA